MQGWKMYRTIGPLLTENFEVPRKYFKLSFAKYFKLICTWVSCATLVSAAVESRKFLAKHKHHIHPEYITQDKLRIMITLRYIDFEGAIHPRTEMGTLPLSKLSSVPVMPVT